MAFKIKFKGKDNKINRFRLDNSRFINGLLLVIFTAILFFITIHKYEGYKLKITLGDIVTEDIRSTKEIHDVYTTEKLKEEAVRNVEPRYRIAPSVQMKMKDSISNFLDTARDIKAQDNISLNKKVQLLDESSSFELLSSELYTVLRMDYKNLNNFENVLMDLITQLMGNGIKNEELNYEKENLRNIFDTLNLKEEEKLLGLALMTEVIEPNEFIDFNETERIKKEEESKVKPVIIKENEVIAFKGEIINQNKLNLIRESGLLKEDNKIPLNTLIGIGLLIIISIGTVLGYIYYFNSNILDNNKFFILLLVNLAIILISQGLNSISSFIIPVSAAALLIALLIDHKLALINNIFLSFYLGFLLKLDISVISMLILGGSLGVLTVFNQHQRYNILINGLTIGTVNLLTIVSFGIIKGVDGMDLALKGLYSMLNGIISGIITLGSLPIWENTFSVLTPIKLLELSNPNQPLLRRLLLEAPGTYHHSLLVGNLSESAAEEIGANPLLVRVGAYYHDIGKANRPYYFKENQFGMENPHDKLKPIKSTEIITAHTTDGINMAKEKRLPMEIIDIIDQHHGDTAVAYFYHKAKEKNNDVNINQFRYKGRKPQTKEAALVMLADSTEAAVRSIKDPTKEKIEDMVRKVVKGKLNDGQLDECHITLKEIEVTINTFTKVLFGIYHDRIEYPEIESTAKEGN